MTTHTTAHTTAHTAPNGRLSGRTAVVTGSTSGIGAATAEALAAEGAHVLVSGRDEGRGMEITEGIRAAGGRADFLAVDLTGTYADLRDFAAGATGLLGGRVDILVNNAGVYPVGPTAGLADDDAVGVDRGRRAHASAACRRTTKRAPITFGSTSADEATRFSARMLPPCASTICLEIDRPSPEF